MVNTSWKWYSSRNCVIIKSVDDTNRRKMSNLLTPTPDNHWTDSGVSLKGVPFDLKFEPRDCHVRYEIGETSRYLQSGF